MNFRTTITLFVTVVIVAVAVWFMSNHQTTLTDQSDNTQVSTAGQKLLDLDSSHVNSITIAAADGNRTSLQKTGEDWKLTEPVQWPAVGWQTTDLLRSLTDMTSQGRPQSISDTDAGLDQPRYKITLVTDDGKTTNIDIGATAGVGDSIYARVNGGDVNLVDSSLAKTLKTAADDLRDKHLLTLKAMEIKQLRVTRGKDTLAMAQSNGRWQILAPRSIPGDAEQITTFLSNITSTEATNFLKPDSSDIAFAGFDRPTAVIWLSTDSPTTQPTTQLSQKGVTLTIGAPDSVIKDKYFIRLPDGTVGKISKDALANFSKTPLDLRDRDVLNIHSDHVSRIELEKYTYGPAATQPTTKPSAPISSQTIILTLRPKPATLPTTQAATQAATKPTLSTWVFELPAENVKLQVDDAKVTALLSKLSPVHADQYLDKMPLFPPSKKYDLNITVDNAQEPYHIQIIQPTNGQTPYALCNSLIFNIPTTFIDALDVDFRPTPAGNSP